MDISSVNSDLIRGNVTTIILGSLWSADRYGYDILKEIETKSNGLYKLKQPTLYSQLKRLEKQGLISSYEGDPDDTGGGKRRYYSLTPEGRDFLKKEKSEYEYSRTILDKLVSDQEYDSSAPAPFEASELRPYSKRDKSDEDKPKVVYKDKIVEVEVEKVIEKKIYLDRFGNEISEEEARQLAEQERIAAIEAQQREEELRRLAQEEELRRKEEQSKPSQTLAEIFAKLDEQSEYKTATDESVKPLQTNEVEKESAAPSQHTYINPYNGEPQPQQRAEATLSEIFRRLDEREAEIDHKAEIEYSAPEQKIIENDISKQQQAVYVQQSFIDEKEFVPSHLDDRRAEYPPSDNGKGQFATSAVINKQDEFDYEREDVNYRAFFSSIASVPEDNSYTEQQPQQAPASSDNDLKTRLYMKGFKIRPYDKGNTSEYYTFNFLQSNRINRDAFLIILGFFVAEVAIMWISMASRVSYTYFLPILLIGSALCLIPSLVYLFNPTKRVRANFNFKFSILNRSMLWIELTVVCILICFFALGASVNDTDLIICSIVLPMVLLTNLPLSSLIYWLLYRTKRYHIA